jgi:hypothetical protein
MALMGTVCVIEAQHAAIVDAEQMGQEEGEIVSNRLALFVDPDLLTKNADPTRTPKTSLVINFFSKASPSTHEKILIQVMHLKQHLPWSDSQPETAKGPLVGGPSRAWSSES